jgi:hypothetical protein
MAVPRPRIDEDGVLSYPLTQPIDESLYVRKSRIEVNIWVGLCLDINHDKLTLEIISGNGVDVVELLLGITVGDLLPGGRRAGRPRCSDVSKTLVSDLRPSLIPRLWLACSLIIDGSDESAMN